MTGEHIRKAVRATATSDAATLFASSVVWSDDAGALEELALNLAVTASKVKAGFSDGVEGDPDGTAERGSKAFLLMRDAVLERKVQMASAGEVLLDAQEKLAAVEAIRTAVEDNKIKEPGAAPTPPSIHAYETRSEYTEAKGIYDTQAKGHAESADAYAAKDEEARKALAALDVSYARASEVLAKIHGEPVYPEDIPPPGEDGPGGFPGAPTGGPRPPGGILLPPPLTTGHPPHVHVDPDPDPGPGPGPGPDIDHPVPGPVGGTLGNPGGPHHSGGPGINPIIGGGLAAGVFGGPGLVNAVRGVLGGRGGFGSTNGTIGSTTRTGGAGTLGRSGGAVPGSQAGRSGGRAGGAGGGRGAGGRGGAAPGTAGGRGRGGGRGVTAAGAGAGTGGRGRKDRDDDGRERDLFDDGSDWIDDEGVGPDVLG